MRPTEIVQSGFYSGTFWGENSPNFRNSHP